jgi:NitT/TauT family transport system permease protein
MTANKVRTGNAAALQRNHPHFHIIFAQLALGAVLLGGWEAYGRFVDSSLTSTPSDVAVRLAEWTGSILWLNLLTTLLEIGIGIALGVPTGVAAGLLLGRAKLLGALLRPIVTLFYSVPFIALTPLLIMWFGVGLAPKVILVAMSSFFLMFFGTFSGAQSVDPDLIATVDIMGASARERFLKVIAPACSPWIVSGIKTVLPFGLIGATIGEMLAAQSGVGSLLSNAANDFDMAGFYAALFVLMVLGILFRNLAQRLEGWLLRWRQPIE